MFNAVNVETRKPVDERPNIMALSRMFDAASAISYNSFFVGMYSGRFLYRAGWKNVGKSSWLSFLNPLTEKYVRSRFRQEFRYDLDLSLLAKSSI